MYTRILTRAACAALAFASVLPGAASASMVLRKQCLRAPDSPNLHIDADRAVISGDWIALFGRSTSHEGGGEVMLYHRGKGGGWTYAQTLSPPDAESCADSMAMRDGLLFVACPRALDVDRLFANGRGRGVYIVRQCLELVADHHQRHRLLRQPRFRRVARGVRQPAFRRLHRLRTYGRFARVRRDAEVFDISALPVSYMMQVLPDASIPYLKFRFQPGHY